MSERVPPGADRFFLCYFETTRRCNLQCPYCMSRPLGRNLNGHELDTNECKRLVLDGVAEVSTNAAVAFSGGEHLMRPDAFELLQHAASLGLWSFLNTNGRLLLETDAIERALAATGGRLIFAFPLNSVDPQLNRLSRADDTETVLKAAETCRRNGAEYFFILTVSRQNLPTLRDTVTFLKLNRVPLLRAPFVPRGCGANYQHLVSDRAEMETRILPALSANPLAYISFTPFFAAPERISEIWKRLNVGIHGLGCHAARAFAAVGAEGSVAPCVQLLDSAVQCGNVRQKRLPDIIREDAIFQALRTRQAFKGKCGRCRYLESCGGCRALAYYASGDVLAEDPTCFFEPQEPSERSPLEPYQTAQLEKFVEYVKYSDPWNAMLLGR